MNNGKDVEYFEGEFQNGKKWNGKSKSFKYNEFGKRELEYEENF